MLPVYATLDSATGVVTIASGQQVYSASMVKYSLGGYPTQATDLTWNVKEPGVLFSKHYIGFYSSLTGFSGVLDEGTTFVRDGSGAGAPRRIVHKTTDAAPGTKTGDVSVRNYDRMHANSGPKVRYEGTPSKVGR